MAWPFWLIRLLLWRFIPIDIMAGILPFVYPLLFAFHRKHFRRSALMAAVCYAAHYLYGAMRLWMHTGGVYLLGYNAVTQSQFFVIAGDLTLALMIYYMFGGVHNGSDMEISVRTRRARFAAAFPESVSDPRLSVEDREAVERFTASRGVDRFKRELQKWGFQLRQLAYITVICAIGGVFLNGVAVLCAVVVYGMVIRRRLHMPPKWCTLSEVAIILCGSLLLPDFRYSRLLILLFGLFKVYCCYRADVFMGRYEDMAERLSHKFSCASATPEEIRQRATRKGLDDEQIERLIFYHRHRYYRKPAFERFGIPPGTAKDEKRRWTRLVEGD